jgi:uncharacterized protein (UPF0548 family)
VEEIARFRESQASADFSYPNIGASNTAAAPADYTLDHNRIQLGAGETDFLAACAAIRAWKMFPPPWTRISPERTPIREGEVVAMQAHALGLWWMNACRIVYAIEESAPIRRFGFAYGTLPAHVEQGEERFSVERRADDTVWYDVRAFSRPRYWPVRLARPLARRLQRKFVRDSQRAMRRAVQDHVAAIR